MNFLGLTCCLGVLRPKKKFFFSRVQKLDCQMTCGIRPKILKNLSFLVFTLGRAPPTPTPTHPPPHTHTHTPPHHRWIFRNISLNFCLSESDFFGYIVQFGDIEAEKKILRQSCSKIALVNDTWHYAKISIFALKNLKNHM